MGQDIMKKEIRKNSEQNENEHILEFVESYFSSTHMNTDSTECMY